MSRARVAAARRLIVLVVATTAITVVGSLVVGALAGVGVSRSVSLGLYVVGCLLTVIGFVLGNRGPARVKGSGAAPLFGSRLVRWASPEEHQDAINDSALFVFLGILLIVLGIIADDRIRLV